MCTTDLTIDRSKCQKEDRIVNSVSALLELSAADDLDGFKLVIEREGYDAVDESSLWYGRTIGSKKMRLEERTPLMIASMFGSKQVLSFLLGLSCVDVNKACGSDRATALHLAVAGGSNSSVEVVKLLIDASANINCLDVHGNRPLDLIPLVFGSSFNSRRKFLELMLKGCSSDDEEARLLSELAVSEQIEGQKDRPVFISSPIASKDGVEKKEYPVDLTLPDMKNGIYSTDEFRMYTFKIKPCSRAYSHDWTECPFVHPGENARRRDPRKFNYSCVPCPEFRKGSCRQGDACEYAHGIFECWLHPAQYRTRLCKDEIGCNRKVCFFAHKPEELRPLHPSTGSAVLSPRSFSLSSSDISSISPFSLGSPSIMIPPSSTPPMTPSGASSPRGGSMWPNQLSPNVKLLSSRFKTPPRDFDLEDELIGLESYRYRQQQMVDDFAGLSSPSGWNNNTMTNTNTTAFAGLPGDLSEDYNARGGFNRNSLELLASVDPVILSQLQGLTLDAKLAQLRQNANYSSGLPSSPLRMSSPSSFAVDQALNSRSAAFAKRSQSFIDRGTTNRHSGFSSPVSSSAATMMSPKLSDWGSPDGKLNWGIQKEELNKLRKSASFGVRSNGSSYGASDSSLVATAPSPGSARSLAKDSQMGNPDNNITFDEGQHFSPWMEQLYIEQEQLVA